MIGEVVPGASSREKKKAMAVCNAARTGEGSADDVKEAQRKMRALVWAAENNAIVDASKKCQTRRRKDCHCKGDFVDADSGSPGTQSVSRGKMKCRWSGGSGTRGKGVGASISLIVEYKGECKEGSLASGHPDRFNPNGTPRPPPAPTAPTTGGDGD